MIPGSLLCFGSLGCASSPPFDFASPWLCGPSRFAVAAVDAADVVVLVVDNAKDGGGEGHDRHTIALADDQQALADAVLKAGKPTALVLVNGGIIAIDALKESAPAILEAWMPGVHGAQAVAETLFGANNPGGKLPVTLYKAGYVDSIDFLSMDMTAPPGRSYRYFSGEPLWPFGFGLSYTTFDLAWSPTPPGKRGGSALSEERTRSIMPDAAQNAPMS